ncbi:hypothetical protein O3P69_000319 [Scylla paramamosain]|uniref:G protein-coupled receptor n=2 Tax=Scylla paramamosain TaxID=85552 RepID=A0AAW0UWV4_SCYPA
MINNKAGPAFSNATYVMYYAVPYFVTLLASLSMIKRLLQQRKVTGSAVESSLDHVIHATTLVIFVLLAMDFPHIVLHMFPGEGLPSVIIHMIFFHHLTAVPIIFVGYNPSHRRAVLRILHRHLPPVCRRVLPQPPCASVVYCDSVEMRATHKFTTTAE